MLQITPQNNTIEFKLKVENASLQNTSTRLIVELNDDNLTVPLNIDEYGNCKGIIPLKETWDGRYGKVKIEVITEGSYFKPFEKKVHFGGLKKKPTASINEVTLKQDPLKSLKQNPFIALMEQHQSKMDNKVKTVKKPVLKNKNIKDKIDNKLLNEMKSFFSKNKTPQNKEITNFFKSI